ncbi:unnamed protein product [Pleuronectes platessa]|uniref:Uncharacterized protein n=1 Tax=Pleuronectes platessa TaxID=8262 RepID=A0A9N7W4N3_PLEPL|nr:unnamed protein product [Pleuronectes platessa]
MAGKGMIDKEGNQILPNLQSVLPSVCVASPRFRLRLSSFLSPARCERVQLDINLPQMSPAHQEAQACLSGVDLEFFLTSDAAAAADVLCSGLKEAGSSVTCPLC